MTTERRLTQAKRDGWGARVVVGALWVVTVLEVLGMGAAGFAKFGSAEVWTRMFEGWGYPPGFAHVIGVGEMVGAITLLVPALATYGAALLSTIMIGALATVAWHSDPLGTTAPIVHLVVLAIIGVSRRTRRWRPGAPDRP